MSQKRKRRSSVVEFGNGPTKVKIYTINRKDGYSEFTLVWNEGGRRRTRSLSDMEEARMVAQQITVRLANGWEAGGEATKCDLELLRHLNIVSKVSMRPNANGRKGFRVDALGTHGSSRPVWEWKQPCHEG